MICLFIPVDVIEEVHELQALDVSKVRIQISDTCISVTVKPVLSDRINMTYFWLFRQVVAYCCMNVVQKAAGAFCATFSKKQPPVYSNVQVT